MKKLHKARHRAYFQKTKTVMGRAGMQTEARSLVFSLPVSDLAGLRKLEEDGE